MTMLAGSRLSIDIGSCAIKMLQVSGADDKPVLDVIGLRSISSVSGQDLSDVLKSLASESHITAKNASISLSGSSVIVRFISLPRMDDNALKSAIRYEAEKFIPYNIGDCIIDFQTLRKDDKENKLSILLVAAKKEYVQEKIKVVEKAGFSVNTVDVDCFTLANSFMKNNASIDQNKSYAILNIGCMHTNVSILKGDSIYFARDIAVGGNDFTLALAKKLGIDQKSAEAMKRQPPKDKMATVADCTRTVFNDFSDEIRLSFGYYENQAGKGIDEIYITGGSVKLIGLEQMFEETLGSKPIQWDPLAFMDTSSAELNADILNKSREYFSIAAGLVLR